MRRNFDSMLVTVWARVGVLVMVLALSATGVTPASAAWVTQRSVAQMPVETPYLQDETAAAPDDKCSDLLVVGVRGSGESAGMGEKVQAAVTEIENRIGTRRSIRKVALDYPALSTEYIKSDVSDALQIKSNRCVVHLSPKVQKFG